MYASTDKNIKLPKYQQDTAIVYIRVSHPRQVTNYSIQTQIESCRKYLEQRNIKEVGIFIEEGESAKTDDRRQLQNLLYFLSHNKGKVTNVLVYKLDRWARNQEDHFFIKTLLKKYQCKLISVSESIDETPLGKFIEGLFANLSQLDNDLKAERTRACLATKALSGSYPGKAPYGYKNDPATKTIQIDKKYFKHIKKCLISFVTGSSLEELLAYLKEKRLKKKVSNKNFDCKTVKKILSKSMFYAGRYNWGSHTDIQGTYDTMISWEQHLAIQNRLNRKKYVYVISKQKKISLFWLNFNYELSKGFLNCGACGERIRSCFAKSERGKKYPYYYCKNNQCTVKKKSIQKHSLEVMFEENLCNQPPTTEQFSSFKSRMLDKWEIESRKITAKKKIVENDLRDVKEKQLFASIQKSNSEALDIGMLYSIHSFMSKEEFTETLLKLGNLISEIYNCYIAGDTQVKQKILKIIYPQGTLISQSEIINVAENELFCLIKNWNDISKLPEFLCGNVQIETMKILKTFVN